MDELISVIIPVFNVADYIDQCLETVVQQTYANLEILLINDGSTDDSEAKCCSWAARDSRIRFISRENRGVAASRNEGIELARGTYISFVDPDDWLELTYFEKLHRCITENNADFAECDLWRYDNRTGKKIYRACYGRMGVPYTKREHMKYAPTATYKALSRRSLWMDNHIRMPSCSFESPAVYSLVLALSSRIANVREPLYYYRRFRENSLVETGYADKDGNPDNMLAIEAMRFLVSEFHRCGLYEQYGKDLAGIVKYRLSDILATQYYRRSPEDYRALVQKYRTFLQDQFPDSDNRVYFCWGGYNLNRILLHLDLLQDPSCRFSFSSLVSLLKPTQELPEISHRNKYRKMMIKREMKQDFLPTLDEQNPELLFLDLTEERFDILEWNGQYLTDSDALQGTAQYEKFCSGRRISYDSTERINLWKEAFDYFMDMVRQRAAGLRVIVIENVLSERFGNLEEQYLFDNVDEIRRINAVLNEYYGYIREHYPEIAVLPVQELPAYFTDEKYEYGALPQHLNEIVNQKIAGMIGEIIHAEG